ncbi:molybdopterin-dependent oxidoreductase [Capillimicrobium parvum]|uniref:Periplasmic nitrate reductase n=1 Tax=Capillimicrobium parvum TaxID=2884022 RepID=A0A9E6Y1W1_9ACTN|nr:molybdopterin-dependent oxidoreductase [Capillimicrobium parvum]UGS38554.1 Periplasmic nitrate reductase [Capillimicrobium parvum]
MAGGTDRTGARRATGHGPHDGELRAHPPADRWDSWTENDAAAWPRKVQREYTLVPTVCFNCESACGLLAYVEKDTLEIRKLEGNPAHPGSRGRNCAKGPATLNQINDPERILYPLRRTGERGGGGWERVSWDHVLDTFAERLNRAFSAGRPNDVCYFVGRPGEDGFADRFLETWGCDGHNSHTNVCSSGGRAGYGFWQGTDRPSPDYANARFILLCSAHLESGHYFNPHAQRLVEAQQRGAKIAVIDPRLSNTATRADYWLATWPGTEGALLLAIARVLLEEDRFDREFVRRWVNWRTYLNHRAPGAEPTFANFVAELKREVARYTPEFAEQETGVPAATVVAVAREIAAAGTAFCSHIWRAAAAGNLHGWQITRSLWLLNVLTGAVGTEGGVSPNAWNKFIPQPWRKPPPHTQWNELSWPREYPLAHNEMSILFPHFLHDERGHQDTLFTRVLNPVWTFPDGYSWLRALRDPGKVAMHAALTPTWSETAWWADYVLPMGHGPERHDTHSYETHSGRWLGFRQPVRRVAMQRMGRQVEFTYEANPGEVWEEGEFWIELSWRADPDGSLGIRRYYESPYRPGEKITLEEYYRWMFENSVPGLPAKAAAEGLDPLGYMRKYGVVEISTEDYDQHQAEVTDLDDTEVRGTEDVVTKRTLNGDHLPLTGRPDTVATLVDGVARRGFNSPSRKLELYSETLAEWGWPEQATPAYVRSHVHHSLIDHEHGEYVLLPTYRLPTMIHSRSGNAKYLNELSHTHPLLVCPEDAERIGLHTGALARVETEIGWFVIKTLVTEGIRPGVVAASHHMGRWRLKETDGGSRWSTALVDLTENADELFIRRLHGVEPWTSTDASSSRVWWSDAGVHQNITFPVHPDPISGMHCWHQKVRVRPAEPDDQYSDIYVDFARARAVYRKWLALTRPATGELRRPIWLFRPVKPTLSAYTLPHDDRTRALREAAARTQPAHPDAFADLIDWDPAHTWGPLEPGR